MHEIGHVLGLHHPNQFQSIHSQTTSAQWDQAVMRSQAHTASNVTPQADDIQAMQFYYGTAAPRAGSGRQLHLQRFSDGRRAGPLHRHLVQLADRLDLVLRRAVLLGERCRGAGTRRTPTQPRARTRSTCTPGTSTAGAGVTQAGHGRRGLGRVHAEATTLCLNGDRFAVSATFRTNDGRSGNATGIELTSDSGYFYFFNAANIEIVTKVLNACAINSTTGCSLPG